MDEFKGRGTHYRCFNVTLNVKVKGTPFRSRRTHRVSGVIAQLFLTLGPRRGGGGVGIMPRPPLPRERTVTHFTGGCVGLGAVLDRCRKSRPTGIRSPDLPARSESLYQLRYPGSVALMYVPEIKHVNRYCKIVPCISV
jgi:hypothetical protein